MFGSVADHLCETFGTKGSPISVSTACASGATAIQLGVEAIRRGEADAALCVATDGSINAEATGALFSLVGAIYSQRRSRAGRRSPFSKDRQGFVMAEGAGALVLESLDAAQSRGAEDLGRDRRLRRIGGHFPSYPPETGRHADRRLHAQCADRRKHDVRSDRLHQRSRNQHAENDKMEYRRRRAVFGDHARKIPVSSNKSMIGHTLSAAGIIEAVFTLLDAGAPAHPSDDQLRHSGSRYPVRRCAAQGKRCARHNSNVEFVRLRRPKCLAHHEAGSELISGEDSIAAPNRAPGAALTVGSSTEASVCHVFAPTPFFIYGLGSGRQ